jgi:uncharacterized protein DUF3592
MNIILKFILKAIASWKILAFAVIAVMVIWLTVSFIISLTYQRASGKVMQLVQKGRGDHVYYCLVTVFRDATGTEHAIQSSGGSNPPRFPVGSAVTVLYRAQNPDSAMIQDRFVMWIVPSLIIVMGAFYGGIGFIVSRSLQMHPVSAQKKASEIG